MRRIIIAVAATAALAVPTSVAVVGSSAPAFAASSIQCASVKGTITGSVAIGKCSPLTKAQKKTDKSASAPAASLQSGGTLTWTSSGLTTVTSLSVASPGQGLCPVGSSEFDATGSVTGGNSDITHAGDAVSVKVCVKSKGGKISLLKGTTAAL
jgi:hypothetical protein